MLWIFKKLTIKYTKSSKFEIDAKKDFPYSSIESASNKKYAKLDTDVNIKNAKLMEFFALNGF